MDFAKTRQDFPLLESKVYLDSAASSLTPEPVLAKTLEYYREYRANIHRGAHSLSRRASEEYDGVYGKLAKFFGGKPENYVNTKNATEAINFVAAGLKWKPGANIVTTAIEHHSNYLPWLNLKQSGKISQLRPVMPANARTGEFSLKAFQDAIDSKTQLVAVTAASNVLGNRMPVKEIAKIAHDAGALILVDAAQAAGHGKLNFRELGEADFAAFSGHKMLAPTGTGALYHAGEFQAPFYGGGMVQSVTLTDFTLTPPPQGEEAGTQNIAGVIGLGAAIDYLSAIGVERIQQHEQMLLRRMLKAIADSGAEIYGPPEAEKRAGLASFNFKGIEPHQVALMLEKLENVCIRSGHHCAMPLHTLLGVPGSGRASLHCYNNEADVDALAAGLSKIAALA